MNFKYEEERLKHFAGPSGMLHAFKKSDGRSFPCWSRDICHEPDGDIIPDVLSDPGYLGEYRFYTDILAAPVDKLARVRDALSIFRSSVIEQE
ncbi:MAG: hypothetical protein ACREC0_06475 [Methylocella sp.]